MTNKLSKSLMLAALALLWLPAIAFAWNGVAKWKWLSAPLAGVQVKVAAAPLTIGGLSDGSFQRGLAKRLGPSIPFFADAVRLHNQVLYSAFGLSASPHIIIGREKFLHNPTYTMAYCRRDIERSAEEFEKWARMLREIQDKVEARGQTFLYILTPSKIEHLPDTIPLGFPCPSADRRRFLAEGLRRLDEHGVNYTDATADIDAIRPIYGYEPFPAGGIHWTELAAYPPTLEIIRRINATKGKTVIAPYRIAVGPAPRPSPTDRDYTELLNLFWEPKLGNTAKISVAAPAPASRCPEAVSTIAVGGSFFTALGTNLSLAPCPPKLSQLSYFVIDTRHFIKGKMTFDKAPDYGLLSSADVVLVEENAGIFLKTKHIAALHKYLHTGELPQRALY
jgi:alginate O-acetyltransferase complex protein AlgJ